jgi:hypothetical protein
VLTAVPGTSRCVNAGVLAFKVLTWGVCCACCLPPPPPVVPLLPEGVAAARGEAHPLHHRENQHALLRRQTTQLPLQGV